MAMAMAMATPTPTPMPPDPLWVSPLQLPVLLVAPADPESASSSSGKLQCMHCQQAFRLKKELVNHAQRWHLGKRFLCGHDGCTDTFSSTATRNLHRLRRHAANPRAFACEKCSFACAMRADLNQHLRRSHPEIAPPLQKKKSDTRRSPPGVKITPLAVALKRRAAAQIALDKKPRRRARRAKEQPTSDDDDYVDDDDSSYKPRTRRKTTATIAPAAPISTFAAAAAAVITTMSVVPPLTSHDTDWVGAGDGPWGSLSASGSGSVIDLDTFDPANWARS